MPLDVLRQGIVWAMKENLNIQFVYPDYPLPDEYRAVIETIDHTKIGPLGCGEQLDVVVIDGLSGVGGSAVADNHNSSYVWHATLAALEERIPDVLAALRNCERLNVMMSGIETWGQKDFDRYKTVLDTLVDGIVEQYAQGQSPQLNILTDRLTLDGMNNCGAGDTSLTLSPDGLLYICPAYYWECCDGGLGRGLPLHAATVAEIPNRQLYRLDHAPICRQCDAFQCPRCIWQNEHLTGDVNTPSQQQCVAAHLERNASRRLQKELLKRGIRLQNSYEIKEISYLDPFVIATRWK